MSPERPDSYIDFKLEHRRRREAEESFNRALNNRLDGPVLNHELERTYTGVASRHRRLLRHARISMGTIIIRPHPETHLGVEYFDEETPPHHLSLSPADNAGVPMEVLERAASVLNDPDARIQEKNISIK